MKRGKNNVPATEDEHTELTPEETKKLIAAIQSTPYHGYLGDIPDFGIAHLNITEAAELVVINMWYSGSINGVSEPKGLEGNDLDRWLKEALADTIAAIAAGLCSAVDSGKLKASPVRRTLDDRLEPERTHVFYDDLLAWMNERGLSPGDHMESWLDTESTISELICKEVAFLRAVSTGGRRELTKIEQQKTAAKYGRLDQAEELGAVREALKAKINEIHRLESKLAEYRSGQSAKVDRPLHTRQRRTLLTVIAALCSRCVEHDARCGAAN